MAPDSVPVGADGGPFDLALPIAHAAPAAALVGIFIAPALLRSSLGRTSKLGRVFGPFIDVQAAQADLAGREPLLEDEQPDKTAVARRDAALRQGRRLTAGIAVALAGAGTALGQTAYSLVSATAIPWASVSQAGVWLLLAVLLAARRPQSAPIDVFSQGIFLTLPPCVDLVAALPSLMHASEALSTLSIAVRIALPLAFLAIVLSMPVSVLTEPPRRDVEPTGDMIADYKLAPISPEDYTSLASALTYTWMTPIQQLALRRTLQPTDIFKLRSINDTELLHDKFDAMRRSGRSLLSRLLRMSAHDATMDAVWKIVGVTMSYAAPALAKRVLECIEADQDGQEGSEWSPRMEAFAFALCAFVIVTLRYIVELINYHYARQVGMRIRIVLTVEVFDKILRKKKVHAAKMTDESSSSVGAVVNLIATDINNLLRLGCDLHSLYGAPIEIAVATIFLHSLLGRSAFIGIGFLVLALPVNYMTGTASAKMQRKYAAARDRRLELSSEALSAVSYIKLQAAEALWHARIFAARQHELRMLMRCRALSIAISVFWNVVPLAVTLLSFWAYTTIDGNKLSISVAFTSLTLFSMIRGPLETLPIFLMATYQAAVSMRRLERFLATEEVECEIAGTTLATTPSTFSWPGSKAFRLHLPALSFPRSGLCIVEGSIGSGKTALLNTLLGEMDGPPSALQRPKVVAYAGQHSWLDDGKSVRDNILFGSRFDQERFRQTITATALGPDLDAFPAGDRTHVSSSTLSGGQRARLALARALYSDASVVILDDPLAAIDVGVQQSLIRGLLGPLTKDRLVILVTHHAESIRAAASLLIGVKDGRVTVTHQEPSPHASDVNSSAASDGDEDVREPAPALHAMEHRSEGGPPLRTVTAFFHAAHWSHLAGFAVFATLSRLSGALEQITLRAWGQATIPVDNATFVRIYWLIVAFAGVTLAVQLVLLYRGAKRASARIHDSLLRRCLGATLRWHATQPLGRILNRFVADVWTLDNDIPSSSSDILVNSLALLVSTAMVLAFVPSFIIPLVVLLLLARNLVGGFLAATRDIQRIIATSGSPLYSRIEAALRGADVIRAFAQQDRLRQEIIDLTSAVMSQWWLIASMEVWLSVRAGIFGGAFVFAATSFCLLSGVSAGTAGVAIAAASLIPQRLHMLLANYQRLVQNLNAMERIGEYLEAPQEEDAGQRIPDRAWPDSGAIKMSKICAQYAPDLPLALKDVSFQVHAGLKVAIVGRTGSGKSSLINALLRAVPLTDGSITIDGEPIDALPLHVLRRRVALCPQNPVLFSGSVRENLDAFNELTDAEMLQMLAMLQQGSGSEAGATPASGDLSLDAQLASGGLNISAGQRQLLSLARVLLMRPKLLLLDEATSDIDHATDRAIQRALLSSTGAGGCTVLTIAHRLQSVMRYDQVLVLDGGRIVEQGSPKELLEDASSRFGQMCRAGGEKKLEMLRALGRGE